MLEITNLSKSYGKTKILDLISFKLQEGKILGLIGKSGAGKSTLVKCLNLLETPDTGNIIIDGKDLTLMDQASLRIARQSIGVIFQGFNLLNSKTVFENVALPLIFLGKLSAAQIREKVLYLLDLVGLTALKDKYPPSLSGGQKQRVGIARALSTDPKVLLSDEATSALDQQTTNSILDLLLEINQKLRVTIVLITHEIEIVRKICDEVAVLDGGKIVEMGNTAAIILHPKHELTRKLILEEEITKYLEQIADFYKFDQSASNHLLLISFIGDKTFEPILSNITQKTGVVFSILRGELGRIKKMPFGQLLIEIKGDDGQLKQALSILDELKVHYEVIS